MKNLLGKSDDIAIWKQRRIHSHGGVDGNAIDKAFPLLFQLILERRGSSYMSGHSNISMSEL